MQISNQVLKMPKNTEIRVRIIHCLKMKLTRTLLFIFAILGMLPPLVFRIIIWYHGEPMGNIEVFLKTILTSVFTTVTISYGVVKVMIWLHKNHPWEKGVFKRLFLEIFLTTFTAFGLITFLSLLFHLFIPKQDLTAAIFNNLLVALIMNIVLVAITEGIFFFQQWKQYEVESERFKKESIRAQLESLKSQVNPHFLFNSLNTLSSMIDEDKDTSKAFLDDLAAVYRYVLQHKDEEVVLLETELNFIHSFTQLLKKRHGNRVNFHFDIAADDLKKGIPPMTLQLLIENAVKHNIATKRKPLKVSVISKEEHLVIRNNLQKKKQVASTGIGLKNIQSRYQYLLDQPIHINETETFFEVKIPIITMT